MTYDNPPPTALPRTKPKRPRRLSWLLVIAALAVGIAIGAGVKGATQNVADTTTIGTVRTTETVAGPTVTATATVTARRTVTRTVTPQPSTSFGDGTYVVGTDIQPGRYKTSGQGSLDLGCYWSRDGDLSGDKILANGIVNGPTTVEVRSGDTAFEVSGGCQWSRTS